MSLWEFWSLGPGNPPPNLGLWARHWDRIAALPLRCADDDAMQTMFGYGDGYGMDIHN